MSYSASISGHVDSKKAEAEVLQKLTDLAEEVGANGAFSFAGSHFSVYGSAPSDAIAKAREALAAYASEADTDDQVEAPDEEPADEAETGP